MIFLLIALLSISSFFIFRKAIQKKYENFTLQNSIYLKRIQEINCKYKFFNHVSFDQYYIYDNKDLYHDISCLDFLIYQLQSISSKVIDQIKKEKQNAQLYTNYLNEINYFKDFGNFLVETGILKHEKLLLTEKRLIQKHIYPLPPTRFCLTVTLCCSKMNGDIYARKN